MSSGSLRAVLISNVCSIDSGTQQKADLVSGRRAEATAYDGVWVVGPV